MALMTLLLALVAGAPACAPSDEEAIRDTVTGFFEAYEKQEYSIALEFLSDFSCGRFGNYVFIKHFFLL